MKLPKFKPSDRFLSGVKVPCLATTIKNSKLPGVAQRHIAEFNDDPDCEIYLRGEDPKNVSPWQQQALDKLFTNEGLADAVTEGMKEYETNTKWGGNVYDELSNEDRSNLRKYGIAAYIALTGVVIDDLQHELILIGTTTIDGNLGEHGIAIYFKKGSWQFDTADYYCNYLGRIEDSPAGR